MPQARRQIRLAVLLAGGAALLLGCPRVVPGLDAGSPADAGMPPIDAGPLVPDLSISLTELLPDGGSAEVPLESGSRPLIEPGLGFDLVSNLALDDYRLRLFDEGDRVVPSDDRAQDGAGGTRYSLRLTDPLKPGRRYALVLDAQRGAAFTDDRGRPHPEIRLELLTAGEREHAAPKKPKHRRR